MITPELEACARAIAQATADRLFSARAIDKGSHRTFADRRWKEFVEAARACLRGLLPITEETAHEMAMSVDGFYGDMDNAFTAAITHVLGGE